MNTRRHIKRNTVVGLGLLTALAAGGLLVMSRRSREADAPAPAPEQVQAGKSSAGLQPVHRINPEHPALQPAAPMPDELQTMNPAPEESGYESPFSSTNKPLA